MRVLSLDLETYSDVDLKKCGVYRYVEGDFHILLLAYAFDDDEVTVIDLASGEAIPPEVLAALEDPTVAKAAWNAQFERTCLSHHLGRHLSPDGWFCTQAHAAALTLPLTLKGAAEALKVGEQKDGMGKSLIHFFTIPHGAENAEGYRRRHLPSDDPEKWLLFKRYCAQDVRTERAIRKRLERFPISSEEWGYYRLDQRINGRGVLIDLELVRQAIACDLMMSDEMTKRAYALTGLENPNSVSQLKTWLAERGVETDTLGRKVVEAMIRDLDKDSQDQDVLDMLKLRLKMSKSSVKKYQAAERCVCKDGRARGLFQFCGANRTGRFSGRFIQLQNLVRNSLPTLEAARDFVRAGCFDMVESIYGNTPEILSQLVRTMLIPKPGCEFIVADFSAIEARVLAWEAGEQWRLDAFARGDDIYCASASRMFHVPVVKHGINGELRQKGKIAELACWYAGGTGALTAMGALDMGLKESELPGLIEDWRNANPNIVQYWRDIERAAIETVQAKEEHTVHFVKFQYYGSTLWMVLPSGRKIAYINPKLQPNRFSRTSVTFMGVDAANKWSRQETYAGKFTENCTQAIARDLLVSAMWRLEQAGFDIVAHVHDEVIIESPVGKHSVEEVCEVMNESPDWCRDLVLSSSGYTCKFYQKD